MVAGGFRNPGLLIADPDLLPVATGSLKHHHPAKIKKGLKVNRLSLKVL